MNPVLTMSPGHVAPFASHPRRHFRSHCSLVQTRAAATGMEDTIVVAGGGPAGLSMAAALKRIGIPAVVYEQDPAATTASGSALGLWTNAWRALDALGAGDALRELHPLVDDVELCRENGKSLKRFRLQDCEGGPHEFRGVRRANLVKVLAAQLEQGSVRYGAGVASVRAPPPGSAPGIGAEVVLSDGTLLHCAAVIGADGVRSAVASSAGLSSAANYAGQVAVRGIAQFHDGVPCDCIKQVWGAGVRAGMYPISPTELYWFVCTSAPADAPIPPTAEAIKQETLMAVQGWDAVNIPAAIQATPLSDVSRSRIADRWDFLSTSRASPSDGPLATLSGDALHPMTPNLGQGGCTALEDAVVLARAVRTAGVPGLKGRARKDALSRAFREYEGERTKRCLPLTVRAHVMGVGLQLPLAPVVVARDLFVANLFNSSHFLDHAAYDCGRLD